MHAPLHLDDYALHTAAGDNVYPMQAGIPRFLRFEPAADHKMRPVGQLKPG